MTRRTFFLARLFRRRRSVARCSCQERRPSSHGVNATGRVVGGATVARARRSRNGSRARCLHAVREGSLAAPGWDVSLAVDVPAAPARLPPSSLPALLWPRWPPCQAGAAGSRAGSPRVAVLVPQSRRHGGGAGDAVACMQHPARRLRDAWAWASMRACRESEKCVHLARLHAACMAARLSRPLVWAKVEDRL